MGLSPACLCACGLLPVCLCSYVRCASSRFPTLPAPCLPYSLLLPFPLPAALLPHYMLPPSQPCSLAKIGVGVWVVVGHREKQKTENRKNTAQKCTKHKNTQRLFPSLACRCARAQSSAPVFLASARPSYFVQPKALCAKETKAARWALGLEPGVFPCTSLCATVHRLGGFWKGSLKPYPYPFLVF